MFETAIIVAIIGLCGVLVSPFLQEFAKKIMNKSTSYDSDSKVDQYLYYMRHKYNCQRIMIVAYHNGGKYYSGDSIDKLTIKHESVDNYTIPLQHIFQGVTTTILREMPSILKQQHVMLDDKIIVSNDFLNLAYREHLRKYGMHATLAFTLFDDFFILRKFKKIREMIMSVHFEWGESGKRMLGQIISNPHLQTQFISDIQILLGLLDSENKYNKQKIVNDLITIIDSNK